ncbi:hypothetical protein WI98_11645 [Burkholderia vietnamiensis]|nr:hypothetical protein WI94_19665 [Burkholderia vietnamiensis]KVE75759.1 hypothetical protein WI98_11645 [Burkholderia vietnamiensis]KVE82023.1 hypothetical protein WJ00_26955 [Burkholderia vietnamiensis]TPQ45894.1 hypothetical protein C2U71_10565 [Burkholderia ubonensis]
MSEPSSQSFHDVPEQIAVGLAQSSARRLFLFARSMGAPVAQLVAIGSASSIDSTARAAVLWRASK